MKRLAAVGLVAALASPPLYATCVEPTPPTAVPHGATASREEMVAALQAAKTYDAEVADFAACLEKSGGDVHKQNGAVEKLQGFADKFNAELRIFKARNNT